MSAQAKVYVATSYIFGMYGFTRCIAHTQQRLCIQEYAIRNHIKLVAEETEIKTMSHHPILLSLAAGQGTQDIDAVLAYSVLCLPPNEEDRRRIFEEAHRCGVILFFANENLSFRGMEDLSILEEKRVMLLTLST
jgi:sporadic carbohydrate cluster protein (TIGR04323 family)